MQKEEDTPKKDGKIVFPSEKIGVEEQFLPTKKSTYLENHEIRSALAGRLHIDKERYQAKVFPFRKENREPSRYDTVIGQVIRVSRSSVRINIAYIGKKPIKPTISAIMHISDSSEDYVKDLDNYYAAGDIIRAQIIDSKTYPLQLRAKDRKFGVIYTTCKRCGKKVKKIKKNLLQCEECEHKQERKTSLDFGNASFFPEY